MPAMGAMQPYTESRGEVHESEPGVYRVDYGLAMNGEWDVVLRVKPARGTPAQAAYRISTNIEGRDSMRGGGAATTAAGGDSLAGAVSDRSGRRQSLGIRVEPIAVRDLTTQIRAAGRVTYDETHASMVSLKLLGLGARGVGRLHRTARARRRDAIPRPTAPSCSPRSRSTSGPCVPATHRAATRRNRASWWRRPGSASLLWDVPAREIEAITVTGKPSEALPVVAPTSGVIVEKNVVHGEPVHRRTGAVPHRAHRPVWVVASVFQMRPAARARQGARAHSRSVR